MNDVQAVHLNVPLNALQGILLKNDIIKSFTLQVFTA